MKSKPAGPPKNLPEESSDSDSSVYSDLENEADADSESDEDLSENGESNHSENDHNNQITNAAVNLAFTNEKKEDSDSEEDVIKPKDALNINDVKKELEDLSDDELSSDYFYGRDLDKVPEIPESEKPPAFDEYEHDTSDEEDIRNTVGNIPLQWYDEFDHIGYDVEGKKIVKPATGDEIDEFLGKMDDPNYWKTVMNKMTGEKVVLSDEDLALIQKIQRGRYPNDENQFQPFEDLYSHEVMEHPVTGHPPHKRSFIPSKIEKEKVSKLVYAIKMGWIKPRPPKAKDDEFYMLWDNDNVEESKRMQHYIPAPKRKLPGHEESYNPPPEYLFTPEEEQKWKAEEPELRKLDFIPRKFSSLRLVPSYPNYINEWFNRCLDLYLCPRQRKMRVNVDPNDLIPQLPKPKDLLPFPTTLAVVYEGHTDLVRCICLEPAGQFMASGSDDGSIKIWEILTSRCMSTINIGGPVKSISWCPNPSLALILAVVGEKLYVINPKVGDKVVISNTDALLSSLPEEPENTAAVWNAASEEQKKCGIRIIITHSKELKQVVFHAKGDYFACLVADVGYKSIVIHQLSKFRSQVPFQKLKGNVQKVLFHPLRPLFFVATHKHVRIYNLLKQEITKVVIGNCQWISSMAIHPQGDNMILGSYDCKLSWFDLELSSKPYKTLRHHQKAIRAVAFHKRYPLFASSADDGSVIICHGMVYSDLLQNPTIIPVKILKGHGLCLDISFHPQRPWIMSTSDKNIRLYA